MKTLVKLSSVVLSCCVSLALAEASKPLEAIATFVERSAPATVLSLNHSTLSAQISARVAHIDVRVSQQVKKGQRLLSLECDDYELGQQSAAAALDAAKSRAALALSQRERAQQLLEKNLLSRQQWEARDTDSLASIAAERQADIALKQAQLAVERCQVVAPFDGVITQRLAAVGQLASVGTPLLAIVDHSNVEVSAQVSASDAQLFARVSRFEFDFGQRVALSLHNLGNVIDVNTRSQEVRLLVVDENLLPGTAGKLRWQDPRPLIPSEYIVRQDNQLGIFVNNGGVAEFMPLPQAAPGRDVVVDLAPDTLVVTEGTAGLVVGQAL